MNLPKLRMLVAGVWCLSGLLCLCRPASAQSIEDKLRSELRVTAEQLHALQDMQAQLQADRTQALQQRDQAVTELKQVQAELAAAKGKSSAALGAERALAAERAGHAQDSQALAASKSAYTDLLTASRTQQTQWQTELKTNQAQLQLCEAKNAKLYQLGQETLQAYENVGIGSILKSREPFAQQQRVKYDMIAQDYGDQLYASKFDPRESPAVPAPAQSGATGTTSATSNTSTTGAASAPVAK